jgi:hypothetical protein
MQIPLEEGRDVFTLLSLLRKAAEFKGLKLAKESESGAYTEPIATYVLDRKLLNILAENNIKQHPRPDDIFTLSDENWQEKAPGWSPSNYWNFKKVQGKNEFDLKMTLVAGVNLASYEDRGIRLTTKVHGTFLSACDRLPNFRVFKALVESGVQEVPDVAHKLVAGEGTLVVSWTDIGLGGMRRMSSLFFEVFGNKSEVNAIANRGGVFNPPPHRLSMGDKDIFVAEPAQPRVMKAWREQIKKYSASLVA